MVFQPGKKSPADVDCRRHWTSSTLINSIGSRIACSELGDIPKLSTLDEAKLVDYLNEHRITAERDIEVIPLSGGVSSDISLVRAGDQEFVVKQALEKLKVKDDWHCDTARNITERNAIDYVARFMPVAVPRVIHGDSENRLLLLEYLGSGYAPWKSQLLAGQVDDSTGTKVAQILARLHNATWGNTEAQKKFDTTESFYALRIEPYLVTTGRRHPEVEDLFMAEAERLQTARSALVHGDYSAKNIMVSADRLVVLDWEVAWYGDPAFDLAFLLNLLYLKSLHLRQQSASFLQLIDTIRSTYSSELKHFDQDLEQRICCLTLMLMLARIDGKSPAEYLTKTADQELVREFTKEMLIQNVNRFAEVDTVWRSRLSQ